MELVAAIALGIAMGITEFLPVSSLGHSLVLEALFNFPPNGDQNVRNVIGFFIEGGAVVAVLVYYARDLLAEARKLPSDPKTRQLWINVLIAFIPIGILGLVLNK